VTIEKGIGFVQADERRLKQMIVNLLSNAVKFTPQEGRLGLIARVDREEGKLSITVWDNGIGISARDLERLFQPFVQVDSGLSRETSGTGLGLALVAQMARLHGGGVSVESQPNEGSRFTIVLPWRSAEPPTNRTTTVHQAPEISPLAATNNGNGRVILVVEDTEHFVMLLKDYLEEIGFRVESAKNGVEGVAMAISLKPDLILMDVMMPGMDGLTATKLIRQQESLRKTPVIALTALAMSNDRESCLAAGMNDYISKPINMKELVRLIKIHLPDSV
jgi:CheY-like chemotaxis protein/anti-sigma regulatory factor (Ser/Thr protein kinase)